MDKLVVVNRQDCCQARIRCYSLQLLGEVENVLYSYPFTSTASSYTFRDPVTDPAVQQSCYLSPPPPPMQPLASSPRCPSAVGEFVRYLRIAWTDSSVSAATCSGGTGGYINLQELQLIYNGYNVALGKPGTALDVWSNAYVRSNLVDGKSTMYHSLTQSSSTYVQIDLQVRGLWCGLPGAPCHHLLPGCCCRAAAVAGLLLLPGCCCCRAAAARLLLPGCCHAPACQLVESFVT